MSITVDIRWAAGDFRLEARFEAPRHGTTVIFGPSGSGKTSLLRAIAGLERSAGRVAVGGQPWQDAGLFEAPHRRSVGYVAQGTGLFPHLDVRGNLAYGWRRIASGDRRIDFDEIVDRLALGSLLARRPDSLSGGERKRVAIGRALLRRPDLLLLDEPLTGLDAEAKATILPLISDLSRDLGIATLYVTHARDERARLADHLLLIDAGRIVAGGEAGELLTRLDLAPARSEHAEALLDARVEEVDEAYDLVKLTTSVGPFWLPSPELSGGASVRLRIAARDVSLVLEPASETSILNILPAAVESLEETAPGRMTVRLSAGTGHLLARVTRKSADRLGLEPGRRVHAQVKSVALA